MPPKPHPSLPVSSLGWPLHPQPPPTGLPLAAAEAPPKACDDSLWAEAPQAVLRGLGAIPSDLPPRRMGLMGQYQTPGSAQPHAHRHGSGYLFPWYPAC